VKEAKAAALQLRSPPAVEAKSMREKDTTNKVNGQLPIHPNHLSLLQQDFTKSSEP